MKSKKKKSQLINFLSLKKILFF